MVPTMPLPDAKKGLQALLPLLEQLGSMHQHQGVHAAPGDDRGRRDRLAERGRRAQHARIVCSMAETATSWSCRRVPTKLTSMGSRTIPLVPQVAANAVVLQQGRAASRQPRGNAMCCG